MADGMYGWRCTCGLDTVTSRNRVKMGTAAACYACKLLVEESQGAACDSCRGLLIPLGAEGTFIESSEAPAARAYWKERLLDDTLRQRWWGQDHPQPPFPTDATPAPPGWSARTPMTVAYDTWFSDMFAQWPAAKPRVLADAALVAEVGREIAPKIEERVREVMGATRKFKCPRCMAFALTFAGIPFPS